LPSFISGIWQIHAFGEGNTRTTAVFTIKYLRTFGFDIGSEAFANHSRYFRNALVRANYNNFNKGIYATTEYIEAFFRNFILFEHNELKNRTMLVQESSAKEGEALSYMDKQKQTYAKAYAPWTEEDDNRLKQLYAEGRSVAELMEIFERNRGAIRSRLKKVGLLS